MSRRCRQTDTRARSSSNSLISRDSRSTRSASASSKGQSCRQCSDHRKSQASRNSASRHRNNLGLDRYAKDAERPNNPARWAHGAYPLNDAALSKRRNRSRVIAEFGQDSIGMLAKHRRTRHDFTWRFRQPDGSSYDRCGYRQARIIDILHSEPEAAEGRHHRRRARRYDPRRLPISPRLPQVSQLRKFASAWSYTRAASPS